MIFGEQNRWFEMKQEIVKMTLPNGLHVVYVKSKKNKIVITIGVKVGLLDETAENNGISHFLEHVLWEGANSKTGKEIRDAVSNMQGESNAHTGLDNTMYYIEAPRRHFDKALELIVGVVTKPNFNEEEINKEKSVILNEMTRYADHPFYSVDRLSKKTLFEGNILEGEIGGTQKIINNLNRETLELHYAKYYAPNNMVVVISGNIENPSEKIEKLFNTQPKFIPEPKAFESKVILPKEITAQGSTKASYVELAFLTVDYRKKESSALEVIEELLESGKELSLMEEVRFNHGLTYHVHVINHSLKQTGLFAIGLSTEKNKTNEALNLIKNQINKIQNVKSLEVEKAKKKILKKFKEIIKEPSIHNQILADCELTNTWEEYERMNEKIKLVTVEEVKEAAKKYLANNYVQVILEQKEVN